MKPEEALDAARAAKERADDTSIWWARGHKGGVLTHLIRADGTWATYRWDAEERKATLLQKGDKV